LQSLSSTLRPGSTSWGRAGPGSLVDRSIYTGESTTCTRGRARRPLSTRGGLLSRHHSTVSPAFSLSSFLIPFPINIPLAIDFLIGLLPSPPPPLTRFSIPLCVTPAVIVGLRQVHFLAKYWADRRGDKWETDKVAEELFPFISSSRFTLKEFVRTYVSLLPPTPFPLSLKIFQPSRESFPPLFPPFLASKTPTLSLPQSFPASHFISRVSTPPWPSLSLPPPWPSSAAVTGGPRPQP
jgi:hypothetical protein